MIDLNKEYSRDHFLQILRVFDTTFSYSIQKYNLSSKVFLSASRLGIFDDLETEIIEVEVSSDVKNRLTITKEAFKLKRSSAYANAIVAFINPDSSIWRLSLLTTEYSIDEQGVQISNSNPKRFSYLLGPGTKVATPTRNVLHKGTVKDLDDLKSRFSVEVVNKDFYIGIARMYQNLISGNEKTNYSELISFSDMNITFKEKQEFAVRLVGRILFMWFLKQKKSKSGLALIPEELLSVDSVKRYRNYYLSILQPLFFEVLNTNHPKRTKTYNEKPYKSIPYLNGGLFEPHYNDYYNNNNSFSVGISDGWFQSFFEILEQYNFTIDENSSFDLELSIDPEMLGRIFENLLAEINPESGEAARKSTGSFYTPRDIVDYMVNRSLNSYFRSNTNLSGEVIDIITSSEIMSENTLTLSHIDIREIIKAILDLKVIDPACGSGAFPIGMLQKIIQITLSIDPDGIEWFNYAFQNESDELKLELNHRYSNSKYIYLKKLQIIRDSIYGVDIQPIAAEISRLRCFLSLVVEQIIDDDLENRGIEPLPNLDFKFIAANSLYSLDDDFGLGERELIEGLEKIRYQYFNASYEKRDEIKSLFMFEQNEMNNFISDVWHGASGNSTLERLRRWRPFEFGSSTWFDSEWMFGVSKFDIVITNPPYLDSERMTKEMQAERENLKMLYFVASGNWDLFILFIELASNLLKNTGNMVYIVPNKLLSQNYADKCREILFKDNFINEIRDYSKIKVFKDADVYPIVMLVSKTKLSDSIKSSKMNTVNVPSSHIQLERKFINKDNMDLLIIENSIVLDIIIKMESNKKIKDYANEVKDASTVSDAYEIKESIYDSKESEVPSFRLVNSGTIDQFVSLWGKKNTQYIKNTYLFPRIKHEDLKKNKKKFKDANSSKIIIANMTRKLEAFYDEGEYIALKSTVVIMDSTIDLAVLTGLINSKLYSFYYQSRHRSSQMSGGALSVSKNRIEMIPIPDMNENQLFSMKNLVESIRTSVSPILISELDKSVYGLFNLSMDEIQYIEKTMNDD